MRRTSGGLLCALLCALLLWGCGGGSLVSGGRASGPSLASTTSVEIRVTNRGVSGMARAVPDSAVTIRVRALDPVLDVDLVTPIVVARPAAGTTLTVVLEGVPVGTVIIAVEALDASGAVVASARNQITLVEGLNPTISLEPSPPATPTPTPTPSPTPSPTPALAVAGALNPNLAAFILDDVPAAAGTAQYSAGDATDALAVTPNLSFLYTTNAGTLRGFAVDKAAGTFTALAGFPLTIGDFLHTGMAVDHDGIQLFMQDGTSEDVAIFQVDGSGGLTFLGSVDTPGRAQRKFLMHPTLDVLYTGDSGTGAGVVNVWLIDFGTLIAQDAEVTEGTTISGMAVTPDGSFLYAVNRDSNVVVRFAVDGAGSLTRNDPPAATGFTPTAIAVSNAFAYVADNTGDLAVYSIAASDGALTQIDTVDIGDDTTFPTALAISPDGTKLMLTMAGPSQIAFFDIDAGTGLLTLSTTLSTGTGPASLISF